MLSTLGEKIHDNRFLRLVEGMLKAGYLEDWRWNATLSGCPQGRSYRCQAALAGSLCPIWLSTANTSRAM